MNDHSPEFIEIRKCFETSLNEHGYSFQQSLLEKTQELYSPGRFGWSFEVSEFPVEVRGRGTRVDFVLRRHANGQSDQTVFMIAECKRANPAFSNWCFAKSHYSFRGQSKDSEYLLFESLNNGSPKDVNGIVDDVVCGHKTILQESKNVYHEAVAVKGDAKIKGNCFSSDPGSDAIERAASQVCQGLNGFINFLTLKRSVWQPKPPAILIPVIFTTANLWASDVNLSGAALDTGNLTLENSDLKKVSWLLYQYSLSPGIKHGVPSAPPRTNSLSDILQAEYIRTIPVVSPRGIEAFLEYAAKLDFNP